MFETPVALALGSIAALALTIFLYVKVLPPKLDGTFNNKYLQFLFDFFHFKKLYLEEVLKFVFTLATVACITIGAFMLLGYEEYYGYYSNRRESTFLYGICLMVGGPISLRLVYEGLMMFILLVKNTMEINNKLAAPKAEPTDVPPVYQPPYTQEQPPVNQIPNNNQNTYM